MGVSRNPRRDLLALRPSQLISLLHQSILAKAFRGELVPQNPNDEPALALLERIRAERVVDTNGKPVRSRSKRTSSASTSPTTDDKDDQPARSDVKPQPQPDARRSINVYTADEMMPHFRSAIRGTDAITEEELHRHIAQRLGFERLGTQVRTTLQGHLRAAIRRGIVQPDGDFLRAATPTFASYTDDQRLKTFASVMHSNCDYDRNDVVRAITEHLGYSQVTSGMRERMKSVFNMATRRSIISRSSSTTITR